MSRREVTKREVLRCMNSLSRDIRMTLEMPEDFKDGCLPTLYFRMSLSGCHLL